MSDATVTLLVLAVAVGLFVWNRVSVGVVAIGTALALAATGVIDTSTALAGFGDPIVIFIATLFVVSEGIDSSGVTTWAGQALLDRAGDSRNRLLGGVLALVAVLSALVTPNGSTAALIPLVVLLAVRVGGPPSQMLMPLAFTASAGALLALTGSPVNVIVSQTSQRAGEGGFGFFEFAVVGVPLVVVTVVLCLLLGSRLIPHRTSRSVPPDLSGYEAEMAQAYDLDTGFARLRVRSSSALLGRAALDLREDDLGRVVVVGVQAANDLPQPLADRLEEGDVVVVSGPDDQVDDLAQRWGLAVTMRRRPVELASLLTPEKGVAELVVRPRSALVGTAAFPGLVRGDLVVLAVRRLGQDRGPRVTELVEGDTLLVRGPWQAVDLLVEEREVLVVDAPDLIRRQAAPLGRAAYTALAVLAGMVVLLVAGVTPAVAGLVAACAMVLLRVVGVEQAYRAVSWQTLVLIGGLIPLSAAMSESGLATSIADGIVGVVGDGRPLLLLLALFVLTAALGQVVSNTATVLVVAPIAVAAAAATGVSVQPVLMVVAVAGAASLLTPIATPANTMVMGPGGYRFGDYWRLGLPIMGTWLVIALAVIPLVWPLTP